MLSRREDGRLSLSSIDLQIFLGDLFAKCNTEREIEWLQEQITSCTECISDERYEEIEE